MQAKSDTSRASRVRIASLALAAGLLTLLCLSTAPAPAQLANKIASTRQRIAVDRAKEGVLSTTIGRYSRRISRLQGQVAGLRNREDRVQRQLDIKEAQLKRARLELRRERVRLHLLRLKLRRSIKVLSQRLVAIYKSDDPDIITVLLQSNGFDDLLERSDYMQRIGDQDNRQVARVRTLRNEARGSVSRLARLKARVQDARDGIAAKRRELAQARGSLEVRQGALSSARGRKQAALSSIQGQRRELERILAADEARIQRTLRSAPGPGINLPVGPIRGGSSGLIWPVNGPVVSPFGMRWGRLHAGIDIAVPSGTPIRAAKSGVVALAGWVGGYGNYTCINHGGGLATCYAHQQSFAVGVGSDVSQGQVIGYSDCTGHCFGPHLHFEVRINGTPVDPMGYL